MRAHRVPSLSAAGLLLVVGLSLTGCVGSSPDAESTESTDSSSASPSPEASPSESEETGQSVAEACAVLEDGVLSLQEDLNENFAALQSDPAAASAAIDELSTTFTANAAEVTNAEVAPVATAADAALIDLAAQLRTVAADPAAADVEALTTSATALQTSFTELGTVCT